MTDSTSPLNLAQAAIAIIEFDIADQTYFLLIERATDPNDYWSGHLSFPGGRIEQGESPLQAVIRECSEEVGLELNEKNLIDSSLEVGFAGKKDDYGLWVKPFVFKVGPLKEFPNLKHQISEVQQILWLKKSDFLNRKLHVSKIISHRNYSGLQAQYILADKILWGYSYKVLCNYSNINFDIVE